jgi:uncharacterized integral membrane protein (TIGR00698 family)
MRTSSKDLGYALLVATGVALAFIINNIQGAISPLFISLVLGLIITNTFGWSDKRVMNFAAKRSLRFGVVLLGFQITLDQFLELGAKTIAAVIIIVTVVFFGVRKISMLFGLSRTLATFIAGGFAICGATAIAAISSTIKSFERENRGPSGDELKAKERDLSYAVAIVAICGTLSVVALPFFARVFGLTEVMTGAWIGAAVHDVGQVVATASLVGTQAIDSSIIVKLTRVVLLVPLILFLVYENRDRAEGADPVKVRANFPLFVLFFIAVAIFSNLLPDSDWSRSLIDFGEMGSKIFLAVGLFGMGLGVKWRSIRLLGRKPLILGLSLWILSASFALGLLILFGF